MGATEPYRVCSALLRTGSEALGRSYPVRTSVSASEGGRGWSVLNIPLANQ